VKNTVSCDECGIEFEKKPCLVKRSNNDFCSKGCRQEWEAGLWRDEKALREAYYEEGTQPKVAERFGCSRATIRKWMQKHDIETFNGDPSRTLYDREKLTALYEQEQSVERVLKRLPQTTSLKSVCDWLDNFDIETNFTHVTEDGRSKYTCDWCGDGFTRFQSKVGNPENVFCQKRCFYSWKSENTPTGEDHPRWTGGYEPKYSDDWRSVRREVRNRDGVCRKCGKKSKERELDVHHIKPVRKFDSFDDAHNKENLVALCRSCHSEIEQLSEVE
jgi:5-methylcytosine-specific restriction endonuclease McrA